jgi:formylglycine-generating enzyme required for sulfatase activity
MFKKRICFFLFILISNVALFANNISVSNISITGQNTAAGANNPANYTFVKFDLSWENSWRNSSGTSNWDAAWVFVKYRVGGGDWQHARLHGSGHQAPAGSSIDVGLLTPGSAFNFNTNPGIGAFVYRSANGSDTFSPSNIQLRWNYGSNGVSDNAVMEIKVFAIEMVYVPQGPFYLGDGGNAYGGFYNPPGTSTPYQILSENTDIIVGNTSGNLYYNVASPCGDQTGTIPASFPKGFNAIYGMKYEVTQAQYVDFLNTLTLAQQTNRIGSSPNATAGTGALDASNTYRNGIDIQTSSVGTTPAIFACNLNGNATYNEANDGQWLACNFLSWADLAAYLHWSGLRPMSELEFEKVCRGSSFPIPGEYAWGSTTITQSANITNGGASNESCSTSNANAVYSYFGPVPGPMRVGVFANSSSTREQAGAGFYGMMELSGNNWERCVTVGNAAGRSFAGSHGNGILSGSGYATFSDWPGVDATGSGFRGCLWSGNTSDLSVSDRGFAANTISYPYYNYGGRGVRTAP